MNNAPVIKVLLIEDDQDDYILTRDMLESNRRWQFKVEWICSYDSGLLAAIANRHDVCLVDYRLGANNGVELVEAARARGCQLPLILLTGLKEDSVDFAATRAGADDYLVKDRLEAGQLERTIRYAIERKRSAAHATFEQARLAAFGADVGLVLTRADSLDSILDQCAKTMARYLNGALAQIWIHDEQQKLLLPRASAGTLLRPGLSICDMPSVSLPLEQLQNGKPVLIKNLAGDPRLSDQYWAQRKSVVAYAAHPLLLEGRLVGMMSLFSADPLTEVTLQEMASVANGIALCIERKHSEIALDVSEDKYQSVVENIREVVFQTNDAGRWTFLNPAWTITTGFPVADTLGRSFLDFVHPDDHAQSQQSFDQLITRKVDYCRHETRLQTQTGEVRWVEVYAQPTQTADGKVLGLSGSLNDITERKEAEAEIRKLAAFPRVNPNPILEFAANGTISYFNDAAQKLAASLHQAELQCILPPDAGTIAKECLATGKNRLRLEVVVAGRTLTWSFFPVASIPAVHCYGADVSDVVTLEAQFRHAQKLESVGQLAAGIAHDFNNNLTVIEGYTSLLLKQCSHDSSVANQLKIILDAAQRTAGLTRQLLMFSRKQVVQPQLLCLNSVLQNLGAMLGRLLGEDIAMEIPPAAQLSNIHADPGMIEQVVLNLAINARDAMPGGGRLRIATSTVDVDTTHAECHVGASPGRFACLEISDTGCGMDADTLSRIFEPFFTTKEVGKGSGLGLATIYGIVKQHTGWIEVASEVGKGTTFRIFLPAVEGRPVSSGDTLRLSREIQGGNETILLVEDEPVLLEMVREILQGYKYRVLTASNGLEALELWNQYDGKIDLLLTDVVMPNGMNGRELATKLSKGRPDLKVIYTSGYSSAIVDSEPDRREGLFLAKPFRPPALADLVRKCLDSAAN
jgi:two-component system, cell cycle sensor histidine kinase and response regulator CckA